MHDAIAAVVVLDADLARSLPAHQWRSDQRMGPCARCGHLTNRYGAGAVSTLCGDCRTTQTTGQTPDGNPTQPSQG
jgi:hypothetical protein